MKEKISIYTILNYGWAGAIDDPSVEITGLDETFDFERVKKDQPSRVSLSGNLHLVKLIDPLLTDEQKIWVIENTFRNPFHRSKMIDFLITDYKKLIDKKIMDTLKKELEHGEKYHQVFSVQMDYLKTIEMIKQKHSEMWA